MTRRLILPLTNADGERGQMGWWACVSEEKEPGVWEEEFSELLKAVRNDDRLTLVDCHI